MTADYLWGGMQNSERELGLWVFNDVGCLCVPPSLLRSAYLHTAVP